MTPNEQRHGQPAGISHELRPYVDSTEAEGIDRVAEQLRSEHPLPRAAFRSQLRAHLTELARTRPTWRPRHLPRLVLAYAASGAALLAIAAIGLSGTGPLGY